MLNCFQILRMAAFKSSTYDKATTDRQNEILMKQRQVLPPSQQEVFDKLSQAEKEIIEPGEIHEIEGNEAFIEELEKIEDKPKFFRHFQIVENRYISVDGELKIHPNAFMQMSILERKTICKYSEKFKTKQISETEFDEKVKEIREEYPIVFERALSSALEKIKQGLHVSNLDDVCVSGKNIFVNLEPFNIYRLDAVFRIACRNYAKNRIDFGMHMAEKSECTTITEVAAAIDYFNRYLDDKIRPIGKLQPDQPRPKNTKAENFYAEKFSKEIMNNPLEQETALNSFKSLVKNVMK